MIWQGWDDPYVPRTHEGLLKWKYPEMNSVDFLFEVVFHKVITSMLSLDSVQQLTEPLVNQVDKDGHGHMFLYKRGEKTLMEGNRVVFEGLGDILILGPAFYLSFLCLLVMIIVVHIDMLMILIINTERCFRGPGCFS